MSLLPSNATQLERAIEAVMSGMLTIDVPVDRLWSPERCPAAVLPYLAWAFSVDEWDRDWPEERQRAVVAEAIAIQRRKGTPWAIRRTLALMGYGDALITEAGSLPKIGAAPPIGGEWRIGWAGMIWADYIVEIQQPITRADADRIAVRLSTVQPARCRLWKIIIADGVYYTIGDGLWPIGDQIVIGGSYNYEVQPNA